MIKYIYIKNKKRSVTRIQISLLYLKDYEVKYLRGYAFLFIRLLSVSPFKLKVRYIYRT
ncbi:hypothetical protein KL86DYS1_10396 [uncultured Dysgonomonas sp.]|uniref:Uncharacterized protein n=1 Tax=uncultured Dysgonomonas sp. TaxID=206096 RepID=A0A212IWV8_9BACT|nr:hypothetical protein KL86DYS1_10396 [uncultured Dysgonomonas sp.]